jgi:hypothetical protein
MMTTRAPVRGCRGQLVLGGAPSMHRREKSVDLVLVPFVKVLCSNAKKFALCTQKVTITLLGLDDAIKLLKSETPANV